MPCSNEMNRNLRTVSLPSADGFIDEYGERRALLHEPASSRGERGQFSELLDMCDVAIKMVPPAEETLGGLTRHAAPATSNLLD